MASVISASTTSATALNLSGDTSGVLQIATGATPTTAIEIDGSQVFKFNSGYGSVATAYGCRAWVNFNGTGTVAIRASGNVSSITDNGVGLYTINFTNAMPDANYSLACSSSWDSTVPNAMGTIGPSTSGAYTTSSVRISTGQGTGTLFDTPLAMVHVFR